MKKTIFVVSAVFTIKGIAISKPIHIESDTMPTIQTAIRLIKECDAFWEVNTNESTNEYIKYTVDNANVTLDIVYIHPLNIDRKTFTDSGNLISCGYVLLDAVPEFMVDHSKDKIIMRGNGYTLMLQQNKFVELMQVLNIPEALEIHATTKLTLLPSNSLFLPIKSLPICDEEANLHNEEFPLYEYIEDDLVSFKAVHHNGKVIAVVMFEGSRYLPVEWP